MLHWRARFALSLSDRKIDATRNSTRKLMDRFRVSFCSILTSVPAASAYHYRVFPKSVLSVKAIVD